MISEPFAHGTSVIHRSDPRWRIVAATGFSILVAVSREPATLAAALAMALLLAGLARIRPGLLVRRLQVVAGFLILVWLLLPVTYHGPAAGHLGPLTLSESGIRLAAAISFKSIAILVAFIALVATMQMATLGQALDRLRVPGIIVQLLLMTYRYIFLIESEYQRLKRAAKIRGFRPGSNMHTYRTYAYMVGMLFLRAAERAERVSQAMKCRGFTGRFVCLCEFPGGPGNWRFAVLTAAALAVLMALEWGGGMLELALLAAL
jgi:cobalt/nickel transport system permease protein